MAKLWVRLSCDNLLYFSVLFEMIKCLPRYFADKLGFQSSNPKLKQRHYFETKKTEEADGKIFVKVQIFFCFYFFLQTALSTIQAIISMKIIISSVGYNTDWEETPNQMDIFQKCFSKPGRYLLLNYMIRLQPCSIGCMHQALQAWSKN